MYIKNIQSEYRSH